MSVMSWVWFWLSAVLLVAGAIAITWAVASSTRRGPRQILDERLARGEISTEEYRERLGALGPSKEPTKALIPLAAALIALGLIGVLGAGLAGGWGLMGRMMDGMSGAPMGQMMDGMRGMMRGEAGRVGDAPSPGADEIRVVGFEFGFEPSEIKVRAGETVNLTLVNRGMMFHTLTIGRLSFEVRANPGESITGALTAREPGRYEIVCTVPGHADAGMRGILAVEE